jgi:hypothetical protein
MCGLAGFWRYYSVEWRSARQANVLGDDLRVSIL